MTGRGLAALCMVSLAMLLVYFWTGILVARARARLGVPAPATQGPDEFNRIFRAHVNTLEQLALGLPAFWILAQITRTQFAVGLASIWLVGRILYVLGYSAAAEKRSLGFTLTALPTLAAILWAALAFGLWILGH